MIRRSVSAKAVSLACASVLVTGTVIIGLPANHIEIAGGGVSAEARMGMQFADMARGTLAAAAPDEMKPLKPVDVAQAAKAEPSQRLQHRPSQVETSLALAPVMRAVTAQKSTFPAQQPTEAPQLSPLSEEDEAAAPNSNAPLFSKPPKQKNLQLAADFKREKARKRAKENAEEKAEQKRRRSAKPVAKKAIQKAPARAAKATSPQKPKPGTAPKNNTQGAEKAGTMEASAAQQSGKSDAPASRAGNAAASNYPGKVMARIASAGKPRVRTKGTAIIAFSISYAGALARVAVAKSSGSPKLDRAALALVRKAAPFPKPPAHAKRDYAIKIGR